MSSAAHRRKYIVDVIDKDGKPARKVMYFRPRKGDLLDDDSQVEKVYD
jgi:hypothetical protein